MYRKTETLVQDSTNKCVLCVLWGSVDYILMSLSNSVSFNLRPPVDYVLPFPQITVKVHELLIRYLGTVMISDYLLR